MDISKDKKKLTVTKSELESKDKEQERSSLHSKTRMWVILIHYFRPVLHSKYESMYNCLP